MVIKDQAKILYCRATLCAALEKLCRDKMGTGVTTV